MMRNQILRLAGAATLALASTAANAAITLGSTGTTAGAISVIVTDNVNIPNKLEFDTTNLPSGSVTSFFDFSESYDSVGAFTLGAATIPNSTVSLVELLTGSPLAVIQSAGPSPNTLTFTTGNLTAGATYRFRYTVNMGSPGNISGNATFYQAVPEPATWAMMLLGFGAIGLTMRSRRRRPVLAQIA